MVWCSGLLASNFWFIVLQIAVLLNEAHFTFQSQNHFRVLHSAWEIGRGLKFGFDMDLIHQCHTSVDPFKVSADFCGVMPSADNVSEHNGTAMSSSAVVGPRWLMEFHHFVCMDVTDSQICNERSNKCNSEVPVSNKTAVLGTVAVLNVHLKWKTHNAKLSNSRELLEFRPQCWVPLPRSDCHFACHLTPYLVWSICRDCPVLFWFWWKHVTSLVHADSFAGAHVFPEPFANGCSYADGLHSSVQTV